MLHSESMSRQLWILISNTMAPIGLSVAELPKQITDHAQDSGPLWSPHINSLFYAANMDGPPPRWPASPRVCRLSNAGQQSRRDGGGGHQVGGRLRQGGLRLLATQPAGSAHVRHAALFVAAPLPLHCLSTAVRYHMSVDDFLFMVEKWHALCTKYEHYVESEDEDEEVAVEPAALQPPAVAAAPDPMQVEDDDANRSSRRRKAPRADLSAPGDAKSKYNEWLADENKKKAAVLLERRREDAVTTLLLPCAPTAFVAKTAPLPVVFPLPSRPRHCLCLWDTAFIVAKTAPLPCGHQVAKLAAALALARAAPKAPAAAAAAAAQPKAFIEAATFGGAKDGYAFKAGEQGSGYYRDDDPGVNPMAELAASLKAAVRRCLSLTSRCLSAAFPGPPTAFPLPFLDLPTAFSLPFLDLQVVAAVSCQLKAGADLDEVRPFRINIRAT